MDKRLLKHLSAPLLAAALLAIPLHSHAKTALLASQVVDK
jgi:serine-type D-Ala-D-Ala carboxypeptidase/endopeptidase